MPYMLTQENTAPTKNLSGQMSKTCEQTCVIKQELAIEPILKNRIAKVALHGPIRMEKQKNAAVTPPKMTNIFLILIVFQSKQFLARSVKKEQRMLKTVQNTCGNAL